MLSYPPTLRVWESQNLRNLNLHVPCSRMDIIAFVLCIIAFVFASIDFWYRQHDQFISEFFVKSILFQIFKSEVDYYWITSSLFKSQFFNSHDQRLTDHRWNRKSPAEKGRSLFMNMSWDFWMQNAISQNLVFCLSRRSYQTKSQIPENV